MSSSSKVELELIDDENPEWTGEVFANSMGFDELLENMQRVLRGRPKLVIKKERITIRLSRDVVDQFRAGGAGWQTRIDAALKEWLARDKAA